MKYTQYALRIYEALESGEWRSSNEVASLIATPLANLKSAFERLLSDGVIEVNASRLPKQYRRTPEPRGEAAASAQALQSEIARERVPIDVQKMRANPAYQQAAAKAIGYAGIVLPQENHFNGFFIQPIDDTALARLIGDLRGAMPDADDKAILNALSAGASAISAGDFGRDPAVASSRLAQFLAAIHKVSGEPYFVIVGNREPGGWKTTLNAVPKSEVTMAQVVMQQTPSEYMAGLLQKMPEVVGIRQRRAIIQRQN